MSSDVTTPTPTPAPPAPPAARPTLADGVERALDPRMVPLGRVSGLITTAVVAGGTFVGMAIALLAEARPLWLAALLFVAWIGGVLVFAAVGFFWPPVAYRHMAYRLDADGIQIRKGVVWRRVLNVPRSRVQHTDVSQGPLERSYGLARLVIFTAGTDHAQVTLPGLERDLAFRLRDHLLPLEGGDAV